MASNTWTFTGTILKWDAKQSNKDGQPATWGKGWVRIQLDPISVYGSEVPNNIVFLQVPLTYGDDPKAQQTQNLITNLANDDFILVRDAKVDKIKRWRKNDDTGGFDEYFETGVRTYPGSIRTRNTRYTSFNKGTIGGSVLQQAGQTIIVGEPYMIPGRAGKKAEWKNREIPLVIPKTVVDNLVHQHLSAVAQLAGTGPSGNPAVCGYVEHLIYDT